MLVFQDFSCSISHSVLLIGFGEADSTENGVEEGRARKYGKTHSILVIGFDLNNVYIISSTINISKDDDSSTEEGTTSSSDEDGISIGGGRKKQVYTPPASKQKSAGKRRLTPTDPEWPKDVPDTYTTCEKDWNNILGEVVHQGPYEVCWGVAIKGSIQSRLVSQKIVNSRVNLSAQHLINNIRKKGVWGQVRKYNEITQFLVHHGLVREQECKYTGKINETCDHPTPADGTTVKLKDLIKIKRKQVKEEDIIRLLNDGPVVVVMDLYRSFENFKGEGIYRGRTGPKDETIKTRHAVLLTGYGTTEDGTHYWIIQNSWGQTWGEKGFGKVIRQCSLSKGAPSLFVNVVYPVFA